MRITSYFKTCSKKVTVVLMLVVFLCIPAFSFAQETSVDETDLDNEEASQTENDTNFFGRVWNLVTDTFSYIIDSISGIFSSEPTPAETETSEEAREVEDSRRANPPPLSPPPADSETTILDSVLSRLSPTRGTFIVNTNMRTVGDFEVLGSTELADLSVSGGADVGSLSVSGGASVVGNINASGGITTGGANIDLGGGDILNTDLIRTIEAGENVEITGSGGEITISVPEAGATQIIDRGGGGSSGVESINDEDGEVTLSAGTDIAISSLTISNTSTLETVRSRGGCVGCILDADVAEDLTITGGVIDNTVIGNNTPANGFFTNVTIGEIGSPGTLSVTGDGSFSGRVSGADAVENDEFVTLSQLNGATGGGGGGSLVDSLNSLTGDIVIQGTSDQINVSVSDPNITLSLPQDIATSSSPTFASLVLSGNLNVSGDADITGVVTGNSFVSDTNDATVRKSGEEILRASTSIFPYSLPADTGSNSFVRVSKEFTSQFDNPISDVPDPISGTTREYKLVIKYSDSVPTADDVSWRIYKPSTSTTIDSFTTSGLNKTSLEEAEIAVIESVTIPSDDWRLEVSVPSNRVRVMDIHMASFDVVN